MDRSLKELYFGNYLIQIHKQNIVTVNEAYADHYHSLLFCRFFSYTPSDTLDRILQSDLLINYEVYHSCVWKIVWSATSKRLVLTQ